MSATAQATASQDFTHRYVPTFGKRVHRLGLAGNYGIDEAGLAAALERGPLSAEELEWMRRFGQAVHG